MPIEGAENTADILNSNKPRLYALDGIGGCGKSHISRLVSSQLSIDGVSVVTPKIAGLGDSARVQRLKEIKAARHEALNNGTAPEKHLVDQSKDRIFRLAIRHQVSEFCRLTEANQFDVAVIDRTPLMSWVFAAATNPDSEYLSEIKDEAVRTTEKLGLTKVFLLDIAPETAYSRMIARYCASEESPMERIKEACIAINADENQTELITNGALRQLENFDGLQGKPFESWDLIPISVAVRERQLHKEVLEHVKQTFGLQYEIVNAEDSLENVVTKIYTRVRQN